MKREPTEKVPSPEPKDGDFSNFNISLRIVRRLQNRGIKELFPVQSQTFDVISSGADIVVLARTGTGKTLAFTIPIVQKLMENSEMSTARGRTPTVLVLAPTRELVVQISSDFQSVCEEDFSILAVYGGVPLGPQCRSLREGVDILIGTPGRIIDLMERNVLRLDSVKHVILDEVDRMLDMGFHKDVESIISHMYGSEAADGKPQTLLFSATMPSWVSSVATNYLSKDAKHISFIDGQENKTALNVSHLALLCPHYDHATILGDVIRAYCTRKKSRCIVFCERKKDADELSAHSAMSADCHVFHGDIPQNKRELILQKFREGKYRTLVTTNVAARGLDVPEVDLVVQCHPPQDVEDYIHRSGRTGRADKRGTSIVFYTPRERNSLAIIERKAGIKFRRIAAPTLNDIVTAWGSDLVQSFSNVPEETWSAFMPVAKRLVKKFSAQSQTKKESDKTSPDGSTLEENNVDSVPSKSAITLRVLCCALARLSGKDSLVESRSLLSARTGYTTFKLELTSAARNKGEVFGILREHLPEDIVNSVSNLNFIWGRQGAVFDVPSNEVEAIQSAWNDSQSELTLELLTQLPELEPEAESMNFQGGQFRGNRFGGRSWNGFNAGRRGGGGGGRPFNRTGGNGLSFRGNHHAGFKRPLSDGANNSNPKRRIVFKDE